MPHTKPESHSRRERQIMDIVWRAGRATASEIHAHLADAPSYSAVRALLAILVEKGHLRYERDGKRYVYEPVTPREDVSRNALRRLLTTFFDNSAANLVATLLDPAERKLDAEEVARLESLLARYRPRKRSAARSKSSR